MGCGSRFKTRRPTLSLYFYHLQEGLSSLIKSVEVVGDLRGTTICGDATPVFHLMFLDDCFLFFKV